MVKKKPATKVLSKKEPHENKAEDTKFNYRVHTLDDHLINRAKSDELRGWHKSAVGMLLTVLDLYPKNKEAKELLATYYKNNRDYLAASQIIKIYEVLGYIDKSKHTINAPDVPADKQLSNLERLLFESAKRSISYYEKRLPDNIYISMAFKYLQTILEFNTDNQSARGVLDALGKFKEHLDESRKYYIQARSLCRKRLKSF